MSFEFRPAKRENVPLLIGLSGGSGSGKTFTACLLARGLAGGQPFAFIDTENGRALHYSDYFPDMRHTHLREPYSPSRYADAVKAADAAKFPVIVVDSGSHEYEGEGGVLRMQEAELKRLGGGDNVKMLSWVKPKTEHKTYVRQLLQTKAHVILCMRAEDKIEIVDDPERKGKKKVIEKPSLIGAHGWIPIMEKRLPFELTLHLLLTPDAPGIPKPVKLQEQHRAMVPLDAPLGEETGRALAAWAAGAAGETPSVGRDTEPLSSPADGLARELVEVATLLGAGEATEAAILKQRDAKTPEEFTAWLTRQLATAKRNLEQRQEEASRQERFPIPESAR